MATSANPSKLKGKIALITGGTRGIGYAIAHAMVTHGMKVIITGRSAKSLSSAKKNLGKNARAVLLDVRNEKQVIAGLKKFKSAADSIDILINNAGTVLPIKPLESVSLKEWNTVIETNLTGMFLTTKYSLPLMRDGSVIVNVLSIAAKTAFSNSEAYCASKFGGLGFTESLRMSLRAEKRDIRVVALLPGAIETELWDTLWPDAPRERMLLPETVAQVVMDLLQLPQGATVENIHVGPAGGEL
jgi:NADP-dependent 3-hydroxy acid dehydrogenase YdfG